MEPRAAGQAPVALQGDELAATRERLAYAKKLTEEMDKVLKKSGGNDIASELHAYEEASFGLKGKFGV